MNPNAIGRANVQQIFAVIETVSGELEKPTASGFILPAGQASMSQTPTFTNSEELAISLNTLDQFQDAVGAGDVSVPMYLRLNKDLTAPQGEALLHALMGVKQDADSVTCSLAEEATEASETIKVDTVTGGFLPMYGRIMIDSEAILYTHKEEANGVHTLKGCIRGFAGTTKTAHTAMTSCTLKSLVFAQDITRPTVSTWLQFDHAVMFMSGCAVTNLTAPLSNQGGQMMTVSLQGRRMGWVGTGAIESITGAVITLKPEQSLAYSVGGYVQNGTKADDNSGAGYEIISVDNTSNTITLASEPTGWVADDVIKPWLPVASAIGSAVESRNARVFVGSAVGMVSRKQREGDLTIGTPTAFANEIGDEYVGENADSKREITVSGGLYFRPKDSVLLGKGYKGFELPMTVTLGDKAGASLAACMNRVKFNTPTLGTDGEFLTLTQDGTALGVTSERGGESALYLVLV